MGDRRDVDLLIFRPRSLDSLSGVLKAELIILFFSRSMLTVTMLSFRGFGYAITL